MFILLVDNNRFFVSVLKQMLLKAGFSVIGDAENGTECVLQINRSESPDVLIIDESQCYIDGVDIIKHIRRSRPKIRIIILTDGESQLNFNLNYEKESIFYIAKESITSENLSQVLYNIFTENLTSIVKPSVKNAFSSFRKSLSTSLNF